ncbi:exonuclease SbcCD subunit D [Anaerocolumna sp. AGMB13025]|uniref:exonuclease SbcCD subunit D n=1 Tax=Anaerocolumna sp. AGMB13025 TaxID=3039116 RepID=UPI00241E77CB|nr:exonuclease SbcCD subunit D [Anaerocolumna sp. AGMB13025]WFR59804.1 exonuclease SbcCD subunit D [Anaerocolumna sp. AGMB13025]
MKFLHISDLHIGKKFRETDFTDDQIHILNEILEIVDDIKPDGILIAGDIYDRSVPTAAAVNIFDDFLTRLDMKKIKIFIISGNHDSPERLNFGKEIMSKSGIHIAGTFRGKMDKISMEDKFGSINIYLLPFVKPSVVSYFFKEEETDTYEKAVKAVIEAAQIDQSQRNILVAHQFVTNQGVEPEKSDSELLSVGGLDNIDVSVFDAFDYVALGHIHGPQRIGRETVRYCGTPLKYSFSEANHKKSVTCLEITDKNQVSVTAIPLHPVRDMRIIKDKLDNLLKEEIYTGKNREDYIHAIITDEEDIYDPMGKLRTVYPNILILEKENAKSRVNENSRTSASGDVASRSPMDLFEEFYKNQNNVELNETQRKIMQDIFMELGGEAE